MEVKCTHCFSKNVHLTMRWKDQRKRNAVWYCKDCVRWFIAKIPKEKAVIDE